MLLLCIHSKSTAQTGQHLLCGVSQQAHFDFPAACIPKFGGVQTLDLSENRLSGSIDQMLQDMPLLISFNVANNQ